MRVAVEGVDPARRRLVATGRTEVEASTEEGARAGQDDGPDGLVVGGGVQRSGEIAEEGLVDGIGGGAVEREDTDAALPVLMQHGHDATTARARP